MIAQFGAEQALKLLGIDLDADGIAEFIESVYWFRSNRNYFRKTKCNEMFANGEFRGERRKEFLQECGEEMFEPNSSKLQERFLIWQNNLGKHSDIILNFSALPDDSSVISVLTEANKSQRPTEYQSHLDSYNH